MEETIDSLLGATVDSVLDAPPETAPQESHWKPLYSGLDQPALDPQHAEALDYLGRKIGPDKENRAQAINLSYVGSKMPGWTPDMLQKNWPTVRDTFAKDQGFTQGEPITDSSLYTKISGKLDEDAERDALIPEVSRYSHDPSDILALRTASLPHLTFWQEANEGLLKLPEAPALPDAPQLGLSNPALLGGIYNSIIKPFAEGATSPLSIATLGLGAEASAGNQAAKKMVAGITGLFAGLMGKSVIENSPKAYRVATDPNASTQEKVEAVGGVVGEALLGLLAAAHTVAELHPAPQKLVAALEGKTPEEAATVLRQEANATPEPELAETLNHAAEKFDEIPSPRNDLMGEGAPERGLETPKTEAAAPKTPISSEKMIKVYRGENPFSERTSHPASGRWFTTDIELAKEAAKSGAYVNTGVKQFAEVYEAQIPESRFKELNDKATEFNGEKGWIGEVVVPDEYLSKKRTIFRIKDKNSGLESVEGETPATVKETVPVAEIQKQYSVKNAAVEKDLKAMGEEPPTKAEVRSDEVAMAKAKETLEADPMAGRKLVEELADDEKPRAVSHDEITLLSHEYVRVNLERERLQAEFDAAVKEGKPVEGILDQIEEARADIKDTADVLKQVGTEQGRAFRGRQLFLKEDYSLGTMERVISEARGGEKLNPEHLAEVKGLQEKLAAASKESDANAKALDEYRSRMSELLMSEDAPRKAGKPQSPFMAKLSERAAIARENIRKSVTSGRVSSGIDPKLLGDYAVVAAEYVAKGVKKLGEFSEAMAKEFGESILPYIKELHEKALKEGDDPKRLEAFKNRTEKSIKKLEDRIAKGDFSKEEKRRALELDEAARKSQAKKDMLVQEYRALEEKHKYDTSSKIQKVKAQALNFYDLGRLLMTTGEFSFILRQGKVGVLGHPIMAAKALPDTFRALMEDPAGAHAVNLKTLNHPDAAAAKAAKLHLVEEGASLNKQEEFLMGKMVENLPVLSKTVGRFNRAATVFLNRLRFDLWQSMREGTSNTPELQKQVATFVNEATGRGSLGALEAAAVPLGRAMFSPRYLASRIQLATGHSMWGGTWETRRVIAKEYARSLIGLAAYYAALKLALGDKAQIGDDPRSSDFGKIKIGNSRLDPLAGLSQVIVFGARTATGETVNGKGKEKDIRGPNVPFGGDKWSDVAARFARSKLHPVPGSIINLFDGTDLGGNEASVGTEALKMSGPLTYVDIYQALEEQDLPDGVALGLLAMLGEGLQTYDPNAHKKKAQTITRPE